MYIAKRVSIDGQFQLNVLTKGEGEPILLVHGFPLDHTMWHGQVDALSERYRVIAPDLRGFGGSDVTPGTVTMRQMADDLSGLLDQLQIDQPVTFCGLSMGGYVAWQFARHHSDRLRRLVLCDTRAIADSPDVAQFRLETAEQVLADGPQQLAASMLEKLFAADTMATHQSLVEATRAVMQSTDPEGIAAALRGMAERPDVRGQLPQLPALVICGEHDQISPPDEMRQIAADISNSRYVEIAGAGHMAPLECPAAVNEAIIEFLSA